MMIAFLLNNNVMPFSQRRRRAAYRIWPTREEWHAEHKAGKFTCVQHSSGSWWVLASGLKIQHCSVVVLSSVVLIKSWDSPWTPCNNNAVKKILSLSFFDCTSVNTMCYLICSRVWSMTCTAASPPFKRAWFLRRGQDPMMTFTESTSSYR